MRTLSLLLYAIPMSCSFNERSTEMIHITSQNNSEEIMTFIEKIRPTLIEYSSNPNLLHNAMESVNSAEKLLCSKQHENHNLFENAYVAYYIQGKFFCSKHFNPSSKSNYVTIYPWYIFAYDTFIDTKIKSSFKTTSESYNDEIYIKTIEWRFKYFSPIVSCTLWRNIRSEKDNISSSVMNIIETMIVSDAIEIIERQVRIKCYKQEGCNPLGDVLSKILSSMKFKDLFLLVDMSLQSKSIDLLNMILKYLLLIHENMHENFLSTIKLNKQTGAIACDFSKEILKKYPNISRSDMLPNEFLQIVLHEQNTTSVQINPHSKKIHYSPNRFTPPSSTYPVSYNKSPSHNLSYTNPHSLTYAVQNPNNKNIRYSPSTPPKSPNKLPIVFNYVRKISFSPKETTYISPPPQKTPYSNELMEQRHPQNNIPHKYCTYVPNSRGESFIWHQ